MGNHIGGGEEAGGFDTLVDVIRQQKWLVRVHHAGVPYDGSLLNTLKTLFDAISSTFRFLEMHSKRRYKICICSVILRELDSF